MGFEDEFQDEIFDEMFESFDRDGSGQIEKHEMYDFIARITNL